MAERGYNKAYYTTGRELSNFKLATGLQKKQDFTPEEWASYGIAELRQGDFIKLIHFK